MAKKAPTPKRKTTDAALSLALKALADIATGAAGNSAVAAKKVLDEIGPVGELIGVNELLGPARKRVYRSMLDLSIIDDLEDDHSE